MDHWTVPRRVMVDLPPVASACTGNCNQGRMCDCVADCQPEDAQGRLHIAAPHPITRWRLIGQRIARGLAALARNL
jgi:hypothetical protein